MGAFEQALAREPDAGQKLGRTAGAPPEAPEATVELVVILARLRFPSADATFGPAQLEQMRRCPVTRDPPIESVATEIDQSPLPIARERRQRLQSAFGVLFGVRSGQHDPVWLEQRYAFLIEVFVRDHVEGDSLCFKPR